MGIRIVGDEREAARALNRLARERMKQRLLADVLVDLTICDIEGWDKRDYIRELCELIGGLASDERDASGGGTVPDTREDVFREKDPLRDGGVFEPEQVLYGAMGEDRCGDEAGSVDGDG